MKKIILSIDAMVLFDLGLSAEGIRSIGELTEAELQHLFFKDGFPDILSSRQISSIRAPAIELGENYNEKRVASLLAHSIASGLKVIK
jgi:hypothetical protein